LLDPLRRRRPTPGIASLLAALPLASLSATITR
jgi:hypothetical protein